MRRSKKTDLSLEVDHNKSPRRSGCNRRPKRYSDFTAGNGCSKSDGSYSADESTSKTTSSRKTGRISNPKERSDHITESGDSKSGSPDIDENSPSKKKVKRTFKKSKHRIKSFIHNSYKIEAVHQKCDQSFTKISIYA